MRRLEVPFRSLSLAAIFALMSSVSLAEDACTRQFSLKVLTATEYAACRACPLSCEMGAGAALCKECMRGQCADVCSTNPGAECSECKAATATRAQGPRSADADICAPVQCMTATFTNGGFNISNSCSETIVIHILYLANGRQQITAPPQWNSLVSPGARRRMSCPIVGCESTEFYLGATFEREGIQPRSSEALAHMRRLTSTCSISAFR